tara:strand:+ start:4748 stop:7000 length:2253 start_codon:yes stop_codon:yes gene_type:complete
MAGKRDIFFNRLGPSGINCIRTGDVIGFYGFHHYTGSHGQVYLNEKYDNPSQASIQPGGVDTSTHPLVLLGTGSNRSHISGSGHFDGETVYRMEDKFPADDWSMCIDFGPFDGFQNRDQSKVLVSTMRTSSDTSGFNVGINGANKIYFEYYHPSGYMERVTANEIELSRKNIISIDYKKQKHILKTGYNYDISGNVLFTRNDSYSLPSELTIRHHNLGNRPAAGEQLLPNEIIKFSNVDTKASQTMFVGDFYSSDSNYTGYSGYFNNVVLFSGEGARGNRAPQMGASFFISEFSLETTGITTSYEFLNTGSGVYQSAVTGTGITGYSSEIDFVTGRDGTISSIVKRTELTGELTGLKLTFADSNWGTDIIVSGNIVYKNPQVAIIESGGKPYAIGSPYSAYKFQGQSGASGILSPSGVTRVKKTFKIPEVRSGDAEYSEGYANTNVVFMNTITTGELYEIKTRKPTEIPSESLFNPRTNIVTQISPEQKTPANLQTKTFVETPGKDPESLSDKFNTSGGAAFINGQLQMSGVSGGASGLAAVDHGAFYIANGTRVYTNPGSGVLTRPTEVFGSNVVTGELQLLEFSTPDYLNYDDLNDDGISGVDGSQFIEPYYSGAGDLKLTGSQYVNNDIYMNGQRLNSGINYTIALNVLTVKRSSFEDMPTGEMIFSPSNFASATITGTSGSFQKTSNALYQPQIYLNGIRQTEGINYKTTSDHSLLNSQVRIEPQDSILYGNGSGFFNFTGFTPIF